jgi:hypothetical protein
MLKSCLVLDWDDSFFFAASGGHTGNRLAVDSASRADDCFMLAWQ